MSRVIIYEDTFASLLCVRLPTDDDETDGIDVPTELLEEYAQNLAILRDTENDLREYLDKQDKADLEGHGIVLIGDDAVVLCTDVPGPPDKAAHWPNDFDLDEDGDDDVPDLDMRH